MADQPPGPALCPYPSGACTCPDGQHGPASVDERQRFRNETRFYGDHASVDIWYPRVNAIKAIEVGLMDVRAADSIRIEFDFERNGWVIKQASTFAWMADDPVCDPHWKEVVFVEAWAREEACCNQAFPTSVDSYDCPEHGERKVTR